MKLKTQNGERGCCMTAWWKKEKALAFGLGCVLLTGFPQASTADDGQVMALGGKLEVLWDMDRIASLENTRLTLHPPKSREIVIVHDKPWEGSVCCYHTVFKDGNLYRMYYRGANWGGTAHAEVTCYAESDDGIVWRKPELGLVAFNGSTSNNIVWTGLGSHNFAPFLDANPVCPADRKYKAVGGNEKGLIAFASADGLRWRMLRPEPVITKGAFDSQNLAFWDAERGLYVDYHRNFTNGVRAIMTCTSADFINWTEPQWLVYEAGTKDEHLYTNAIKPYPRAPRIYVGFPKRLIPDRTTRYDVSGAGGLSDGVFMSSRDGLLFKRWGEAFLRPGLQRERWVNRNNMIAWGMVETEPEFAGAPHEWSLYSTENYYSTTPDRLRRMTMRLDGFVSAQAGLDGGTVTTKPLTFTAPADPLPCPEELCGVATVRTNRLSGSAALWGDAMLLLNASTSAAGSIRCEIRDEVGVAIQGFRLAECVPLYGDGIELPVAWKNGADVKSLAGKTIALHFELKDADLFAYRFGQPQATSVAAAAVRKQFVVTVSKP
jgi:hypothetical protein